MRKELLGWTTIILGIILAIVWLWPRSPYTVAAMLRQRGIPLHSGDSVMPHPSLPYVGQTVTVTQTRLTTLSPTVHRIPSQSLLQGDSRTLAQPRAGLALQSHVWRITPGAITHQSRKVKVVRAAVTGTVAYGTRPAKYLTEGGVRYRYAYNMDMIATAYDASYAENGPSGPIARLGGRPLVRGMVAVDPSVIPLGTRLYVQGYGPALAADTGSAIVGNRIDLFFPYSASVVSMYGIRHITVYVLD